MTKESYLKNELYELMKKDESIFDLIQETSLDGIWFWDMNNPENQWMSAKFWSVLGYDPEEMPHKSSAWQNLINHDDLKTAMESIKRHCENPANPYDQIVRYRHKNGSIVWIRCRGSVIFDNEGKPYRMLGTHQDITAVKLAEIESEQATLNDFEAKHHFLFENMQLGAVFQNAKGEIIYCNKAAERILGLSFEQMQGRKSIDPGWKSLHEDGSKFPGESHPAMVALKTGKPVEDQIMHVFNPVNESYTIINIDSFPRFKNHEKEPFEVVSIFNDITLLKKSQLENLKSKSRAEESEEKFSLIVNNSPDIVIIQDLEGRITYVSPQGEKITGYTPEEFIEQNLPFKNILAGDLEKFRMAKEKLKNGENVSNLEYRFYKKNKEIIWVQQSAGIFYKNGNPLGIQSNLRDITSQKEMEAELHNSRLITENVPNGIHLYHLENIEDDRTLRMVYANPAVKELTGVGPEDIIGKTIDENFPGLRDMGIPGRYAEVVRNNRAESFEDVIYGDNRIPLAIFSVKAFPLPGNHVCVTFENITERKRVENALRRSDEKLRETAKIAKVGGWEINLEYNSLEWTEETFRIHELDSTKTPDNNEAIQFYHPDDRSRVYEAIKQAIEKGKSFDFEARLVTAKKNEIWVKVIGHISFNEKGLPSSLRGMIQDITDKKIAEKELNLAKEIAEENNANITAIIEGTSDSIWAFNRNFEVLYINKFFQKEFQQAFGVKLEKGSNLIKALPEALQPIWIPRYNRVLANEQFTFEDAVPTEIGTIYIQVTFNPIVKNGKVIGGSCFGSNITFRKLAEIEILRAKEIVEQSEKILRLKNEEYEVINEELRQTNEKLVKAREEIRISEITYKGILDSISEAVYIQNFDGTFLEVNRSAENLYGYKRDEFIGKSPEFLSAPDKNDMDKIKVHLQKVIGGEAQMFEFWGKNKNGTIFPKEVNCTRGTYFGRPVIIAVAREISERKNAERLVNEKNKEIAAQNEEYQKLNQELLQTNDDLVKAKLKAEEIQGKFMAAFYTSPDSVNINKLSGEYIEINEGFTQLTGYTNEDVIGKLSSEINIWEIPGDRLKLVEGIKKYGVVENLESVFRKKDGTLATGLMSAKIILLGGEPHILSVTRDISERKKHENELRIAKEKAEESGALLQNLADNIPAFIAIVDINSLEYRFINQKFVNSFGKERNEIVGSHISKIIGQKNYEFALEYIEQVRQGKTASYVNKFNLVEGVRYANVNYVPGYNEKNQLDKIIVLTFDITDQKNAELELIAAKEHAEESDRLKTAFLQNMSHEIRTPLNAISGFSGLLVEPDLSPEKRQNFVSIIQNSSRQLISIVTDILTISSLETRQEKLNIKPVCINNIIIELLAIHKQQISNRSISIYTKQSLNDHQSEIYTDETKVTQILSNLLANAIKFTHEGFIEFGYHLKENWLEFFVKDTGIGIKPAFHDKIFERFHQADRSINRLYGGTGLGLAISKAFVELLGGKISVQSEPEKGATFFFTIPYRPVNKESDISPVQNSKITSKTILVAEDEEFNYLYIEEVLKTLNINIIHTKDGQETVDVFKNNMAIDLILMDIKMPILDGYEAAKKIRVISPDTPIVAQSAYALEHEQAKFKGIFNDYLTKPVLADDLKNIVLKYVKIESK
ncbi:MAG: PAS domain S-box protein [Bacteroidales bacterium]